MFAGRYDHALDEKGRTMMPKRFRDRLAQSCDRSVWLTNALDDSAHLEVRPNSSFKTYFERISQLKPTRQIQEFKRFYFGAALEVEVDGAGRLLIPAPFRQRLRLTEKISFVGADLHYFELWHPEVLDQRFAQVQAMDEDLLSQLAELPL